MTDWPALRQSMTLWEDEEVLVVNKPPGLSVMGERHDADLMTMAAEAGERLWWVNRIDKVTSGAVVLAKSQAAQAFLTRQFTRRTVDKAYFALCRPGALPPRGTIDLPLLTAGSGKVRVATERQNIRFDEGGGTWYAEPADLLPRRNHPSVTRYENLWDDSRTAVVLATPVTGRRHQIRVHLAWVGHAIIGDPLFGRGSTTGSRTYLHSWLVGFSAPSSPDRVEVVARPDPDFWEPVREAPAFDSTDDLLVAARQAVSSTRSSPTPQA